jgi:hypothetical protein
MTRTHDAKHRSQLPPPHWKRPAAAGRCSCSPAPSARSPTATTARRAPTTRPPRHRHQGRRRLHRPAALDPPRHRPALPVGAPLLPREGDAPALIDLVLADPAGHDLPARPRQHPAPMAGAGGISHPDKLLTAILATVTSAPSGSRASRSTAPPAASPR